MINGVPTIFEVVTGNMKKQTKEKSSAANRNGNLSKSDSKVVKTIYLKPNLKFYLVGWISFEFLLRFSAVG